MNRLLTLAVCQTGPVQRRAARTETVGRLIHLLERAAAAGAELAVFPEMALTSFFPRWVLDDRLEIDAFYETRMPGLHTQPLYEAARRLQIGFALGYAELQDEGGHLRRYNSMDLVGDDGVMIGRYRKIHVPGSETLEAGVTAHLERRYFEPGNLGFPICSLPKGCRWLRSSSAAQRLGRSGRRSPQGSGRIPKRLDRRAATVCRCRIKRGTTMTAYGTALACHARGRVVFQRRLPNARSTRQ